MRKKLARDGGKNGTDIERDKAEWERKLDISTEKNDLRFENAFAMQKFFFFV